MPCANLHDETPFKPTLERSIFMSTDFQTSETKTNLMRAFAGESQA